MTPATEKVLGKLAQIIHQLDQTPETWEELLQLARQDLTDFVYQVATRQNELSLQDPEFQLNVQELSIRISILEELTGKIVILQSQ